VASVYVSVGHGVRPNGTFDPGAVAPSGETEYDGNRNLAARVAALLRTAGLTVVCEADDPAGTDPDYIGTTDLVNAGGYDMALDCHRDWSGGSTAEVWPLVHPAGAASNAYAAAMVAHAQALGLSVAGPSPRSDLYFLNATACPAVLVESGRVGTPRDVDGVADALAAAILEQLDPGITHPPTEGTLPPEGPPGAPPGDATLPPAGGYPAWPGVYLADTTMGHGTATWQAQMGRRGWALTVDDVFGPASADVAAAFQAEKGLVPVDGVVGPDTWAAAFTAPVT
jgi:N-acetylmuramoyl-L-alanine amidase/Putative peptidoglycan binding domain